MTLEIDIPCSDCGSELHEELIHVSNLALSPQGVGHVPIAGCSGCGARYYPEETLTILAAPERKPWKEVDANSP